MKTLKIFTLALTFLAFLSQAMVSDADCKMMMSSDSAGSDVHIMAMDHDMSSMDMSDMNHDMSEMTQGSMSDCCEQNCTCDMASCSSVVFVDETYQIIANLSVSEKIGSRIFNVSKSFLSSLYRPPIIS